MKSLLVMALTLGTLTLTGQNTTLKLASDVWPPFTDVSPKPAIALDLVNEALGRAQVHARTDILEFRGVMDSIRIGRFDGSAALWRSPERETFLLFSEPYLENRLILVGKKGSKVTATSFSDLKGKRIAIVGSYAYGVLPGDAKNIVLVPGKSDQENLEHLLAGKADYMLADALLIQYVLEYQSKEAAEYLEIGQNTLLSKPLYFAVRKDVPNADKIIEKFNAEIGRMISEGVYNKILKLNWITTDIDGDGRLELVLNGEHAGTQAPQNSYLVKSKPGQTAGETQSYFINGVQYKDWDHVPDKYKTPQGVVSGTEKRGFGPVLSF